MHAHEMMRNTAHAPATDRWKVDHIGLVDAYPTKADPKHLRLYQTVGLTDLEFIRSKLRNSAELATTQVASFSGICARDTIVKLLCLFLQDMKVHITRTKIPWLEHVQCTVSHRVVHTGISKNSCCLRSDIIRVQIKNERIERES